MDKICIIGLGYVGLPLSHAFKKKYEVVGFDIYQTRIDELNNAYDRTLELTREQLKEVLPQFNSSLATNNCNRVIFCVSYNNLKELKLKTNTNVVFDIKSSLLDVDSRA